ncbi:MAG: sigma 54-interacting transcriptional regulator [Acidobacteriota bacterium]
MSDNDSIDLQRRLETETRISATAERSGALRVDVPALTIVAHPDPRRIGERVLLPELLSGEEVALSRRVPLFAQPGSSVAAPLSDVHLSRRPLALCGGSPKAWSLERGGCRTPVRINGRSLAESATLAATDLERGVSIELGRRITLLLHRHPAVEPDLPTYGLVGRSASLIDLRRQIRLAAGNEASVLLRGASGTGKELVARALHDASARQARPFVVVNMAAIPPSLAASELFGAAKGAYTGASRAKEGFFQRAEGGSLFLDEIGETPPEIQPLLLRVLEGGEIQPVGSAATRSVDVRVIAATDAAVEQLVEEGRFRAPLMHRLAAFEIRLPPLRQRRDDVGRLLYHFLSQELEGFARGEGFEVDGKPWPPAELVTRLLRHDWPGNVRQLRNVARRLAAAWRSGEAGLSDELVRPLLASAAEPARAQDGVPEPGATAAPDSEAPRATLERQIRQWIAQIAAGEVAPLPLGRWLADDLVLEAHATADGVASRAAEALSIPETSFRRRLQRAQTTAGDEVPPERLELRETLAGLIGRGALPAIDPAERLRRMLLREAISRLAEPAAAKVMGVTARTLRKWRRALDA